MFDRGPMTIRLISPRSTAPYHTLDSSSRITSPITVAPGTTHALEWMVGPFFKRAVIPACPVGSVSGSMCIQDLTFNIVRSASNAEFWRQDKQSTPDVVAASSRLSPCQGERIEVRGSSAEVGYQNYTLTRPSP